MFSWFKKHPEKTVFILALLVLLPALFLAQHFWSSKARPQHAQVALQEGTLNIHHWEEKGAIIAFVPLSELPIVDINILFPAGSAYDSDKPGLAYLTSRMIGENTNTLDAQSIYEAFENVGADFSTMATRDYAALSLRTLSENQALKPSVSMLKQLLGETIFKEDTFKREQNRLLAAIQLREQSPGYVTALAFYKDAYGAHPYAHPVLGTAESVQELTADDLDKFFKAYYAGNHAVITIVGDISLRQAQSIAKELLENLPESSVDTEIPLVPTVQAQKQHINFPSSQTHLMLGMPAMAKGNPDFFAFSVGNHILGGMPLVSPLFMEVREKEGLAYFIGSMLTTLKQPGPFIISLQTRGQEAKKALKLTEKIFEDYMKNGPTETQIKNAKENINGQFALGLGSNDAIATHVAMLAFYGLPWDYTEKYRENINAVTKEDIQRVFKEYLSLNNFVQVSVGEHAP